MVICTEKKNIFYMIGWMNNRPYYKTLMEMQISEGCITKTMGENWIVQWISDYSTLLQHQGNHGNKGHQALFQGHISDESWELEACPPKSVLAFGEPTDLPNTWLTCEVQKSTPHRGEINKIYLYLLQSPSMEHVPQSLPLHLQLQSLPLQRS